jgi:signal transduction histidine kinase
MPSPEINTPVGGFDSRTTLAVSSEFALFPRAQEAHGQSLFIHQRHAMEVISHEIELHTAQSSSRSILFAGFQRLSRFTPQIDRYERLAQQGHQIYIFGVQDAESLSIPGVEFIFLSERHALAREWFVISISQHYFSALVSEELVQFTQVSGDFFPGKKLYQGIWTFSEGTVTDLVNMLLAELGLLPQPGLFHSQYSYQEQLAAVAISANHLVSQLEKRNHDLLEQQRLYEDLVSMLVHDLRGSLTSVIGSLEILDTGRTENEAERDLLIKNSLENSRRLAQMITNMLDINKIESGHLEIKRDLINMVDLIYAVAARWNVTAFWLHKTLSLQVEPNLPVLIGDADLIERILDNILGNAVKYADHIRLQASFRDKYLEIEVEDNGPGIPPEDRVRIFNKYTQANLGVAQRKGTGLGLAFSKMAVEAHGGRIEIRDAPQKGVIFALLFPLIPPRAGAQRKKDS